MCLVPDRASRRLEGIGSSWPRLGNLEHRYGSGIPIVLLIEKSVRRK